MQRPRVFIFGAGYSGKAFAGARPQAATIFGTTRSPENFPALQAAGIEPLLFDGGTARQDLIPVLSSITHLVVSIAPDEAGDPVLRALGETIGEAMPALGWIAYLSTVGVYGDHEGRWIDETAACRPVSARSRRRVEAEEAWQRLAARRGVPLAVLRLSGIYGPGRNALLNLADGKARRQVKPGQVFNRVHVDDAASGIVASISRPRPGRAYNLADDDPSSMEAVLLAAAERMGLPPPPETDLNDPSVSEAMRGFYLDSKRVSNARAKAELGWRPRYPTWREGLEALLSQP